MFNVTPSPLLGPSGRMLRAALLVEEARGNEVVKRGLETLLGLVGQWHPAIPPRGAQSTRRVHHPLERERNILVWCGHKRKIVHRIRIGVVEAIKRGHAAPEAANPAQIGLDIRFPLAGHPARPRLLYAGCGLNWKGSGAVDAGGRSVIAECVRGNAGVVDLVEVIKLGACQSLLFHG